MFFGETYAELMHKVSWPTWDELMASTIIVTVAIMILGLILLVMNEAANLGLTTFYKFFE